MKIITCAPLPPPHGGIANWYRILQEEGQQNGYTFININTSPKKSINGRSIFYRVFVQGFRMIKQCAKLKNIIKENKNVRVAHIATSGQLAIIRDILFLRIFKKNDIKTVYHIHFGRIPEIFSANKIEYKLLKKAFSMSSAIITIDPKSFKTVLACCRKDRVYYIPNPVKVISQSTNKANNNIIFLGNVLPTKGIEELLQGWSFLSNTYTDWTLTIAGFCEESYKRFLENKYPMKNVILTGYLSYEKANKLLSESAFLILPSYTEGFPNVIIEAMMCGKAAIGTDVGAIADILSGNCGIVIRPKNIDDIKHSIERLITDCNARESMGESGRNKALAYYSSNIVFNKYSALWNHLLS